MIKYFWIVGFVSVLGLYAYYEYSWSSRVMERNEDNWICYHKREAFGLFKPWTWIKKPISIVSLVQNDGYGRLDRKHYYASTMTMFLDWEIENFSLLKVLNVDSNKIAYLEPEKASTLYELDYGSLDWLEYKEGDPDMFLEEFLEQNTDSAYFILDPLGYEYNVTDLISSGQYKVSKGFKDVVFELKNKEPYKIDNIDLQLIKLELDEWLSSKNYVLNSDFSLKDVKYERSRLYYTITDEYSLSLDVKTRLKDTTVNVDFTLSDLYYPQNNSGVSERTLYIFTE